MTVYGLTGGIAAGKSLVTTVLRKNGFAVLDLDQVARDLVQPGTPGLDQVIDAFGEEYLQEDGTLNRKRLAELVFNNKEALAKLDATMGPLLRAAVEEWRMAVPANEVAFVDAALLIEKGLHEDLDGVVLVTAPEEERVRRAMVRDNADEASVRARMRAQMSDGEKRKHATYVLENMGTPWDLGMQVASLMKRLT